MAVPDDFELAARLLCAAAAGAALGFERDVHSRPAGLRTHALVAIGAALFSLGGARGFTGVEGVGDASRIAAQVVSGLGFIGAGAILRDEGGVRGLTTASTIWASGALGVGFAAGLYALSAMALVLVVVVLVASRPLRSLSERIGRSYATIRLEYEVGHGTLGPVLRILEAAGLQPEVVSIDDDPAERAAALGAVRLRRLHLRVLGSRPELDELDRLIGRVQDRPEVRTVAIEREKG